MIIFLTKHCKTESCLSINTKLHMHDSGVWRNPAPEPLPRSPLAPQTALTRRAACRPAATAVGSSAAASSHSHHLRGCVDVAAGSILRRAWSVRNRGAAAVQQAETPTKLKKLIWYMLLPSHSIKVRSDGHEGD